MISFISWYLLITLVGWLAFPLAYRLLPHLSDRGFALTRAFGLLLWGFSFWLLVSFRLLQNTSGGILFALVLLAAISALAMRGRWQELRAWIQQNRRQVLVTEVLFLAAFILWAVVRTMNPDISGTEKPMELAFINAILRSPTFPPHDPWLSGYAISYYYFGYVMVAMLTKLSGVSSGVAFNLAVALWFALTAVSAYGVLYSLLARYFTDVQEAGKQAVARGAALLAPLFLLIVGNLEGFLEMLHAKGIFWQQTGDGWQSSFWSWLNIQELVNPPNLPLSWAPQRPGGIWWWRASRVLQDFNLQHQGEEVIDEFPFFSYLLADLHPHVLAMPFVLLAVGLALNFYFYAWQNLLPEISLGQWTRLWAKDVQPSFFDTRIGAWLRTPGFWLAAVVMGGLAFINTWDFPIYVALFAAAFVLARFQQDGWNIHRIWEFLEIIVVLMAAGVLLYLPFYFGFSSQAGGFLPSLSYFTRGTAFWIMFGSLLIPILAWMVYLWIGRGGWKAAGMGLKFSAVIIFGLWFFSFLLAALIMTVLSGSARFGALAGLFLNKQGAASASQLLGGSFMNRLVSPGMWLTMLLVLTLVWGLFAAYRSKRNEEAAGDETAGSDHPVSSNKGTANMFVLLLVLLGCGLVVVPEFIYLRDQFGTRMNTIFKFYFQTWVVWSLSAAYASVLIWQALKNRWKWIVQLGWVVVLLMGLAYPIFGLWYKTGHFQTSGMTLDGNAFLERYQPDEMKAIQWLDQADPGVVSEAVGGSYSEYARVSMLSGQPTVLGWTGHESQWRGGSKEMGSREADITRLYQTADWNEALSILQEYKIRYVYVGSLERGTYHVREEKFQANLKPVYQNQSVIIYEVPDSDLIQNEAGG